MAEMKKKLDWKQIWNEFDVWYKSHTDLKCKTCGHKTWHAADEWENQQKAIQRIINRMLK